MAFLQLAAGLVDKACMLHADENKSSLINIYRQGDLSVCMGVRSCLLHAYMTGCTHAFCRCDYCLIRALYPHDCEHCVACVLSVTRQCCPLDCVRNVVGSQFGVFDVVCGCCILPAEPLTSC